ncbi:MAG: hypothetical protein V1681_06405, partial [Candidatus Neomarinimicrobiota bacterium]
NYSDRLLALIKDEQERQKRFRVEINLPKDELRVEKGEIIGYTGDSGTIFPHLHFELRDSLENPFNPLNTNLAVNDKTAPTISAVAVTPVRINSRVNGLPTTQTFNARYLKNNNSIISEPIQTTGPIGIEIKTYDTVKGIPNVYPPYGIKLFIDDSLRFQVQYDKFGFEQTRYAEIDRNYQLDHDMGEVYNRLWEFASGKVMPMNVLPGTTGILDLSAGLHNARILAYDKNLNTSTVEFKILVDDPEPMKLIGVQPAVDGFQVAMSRPGHVAVQNIGVNWVTRQGDYKRPANLARIDSTADQYLLTINDQPANNEYLQINAVSASGFKFRPIFGRADRQPNPDELTLNYKFSHNPKTFITRLTFSDVPENDPTFYLQTSAAMREVPLIRVSPVEYFTAPAPFAVWRDAFAFEVRFNTQPMNITRVRLNLKCIVSGSDNFYTSRDSLFTAIFPVDAVYDSMLIWLNSATAGSLDGGQFVSPRYTLYPTNQPLHDSIRVAFKYPTYSADIRQIGVYQHVENTWRFLGNQTDSQNNLIRAATRRMGELALIKDFTPPVIRNIFPGNGGRFRASGVRTVKATVRDDLSGIQNDLAIVATLDDYPLITEYHAPKHYIKYGLAGALASGKHILNITVTDRAGNISTATSEFTIIPDR